MLSHRPLLLVAAALSWALVRAVSYQQELKTQTICDLPCCHCDNNAYVHCVCDKLQEIWLAPNGTSYIPHMVGAIKIEKCKKVTVLSKSLKDVRPLRSIYLSSISHLDLQEEAFSWSETVKHYEGHSSTPGIDINIINSSIPVIPANSFKGHINSITFLNVNISEVKSLAFANVAKMDKIEIKYSHIDSVAPKAFSKFIIQTFSIEGSYIGKLSSHAIHSIEVDSQFRLENNNFGVIHSQALKIIEPPKFVLRSCRVNILEGEAFHVSNRGQVFIDDNVIDDIRARAFAGIQVASRVGHKLTSLNGIMTYDLVFENNTLTKFEEYALFFNNSGIKLDVDRVILNKDCSCSDINTWSTKLVVTSSKSPVIFSKEIWCHVGKTGTKIVYDYNQKMCQKKPSRINWALAGPIIFLIVLLGLCCLGFWCYKKRSQRYESVNAANKRLSTLSQDNIILDKVVLPQRKIYVENELNVLTESVEPIKEYVPPHRPAEQEKC